MDLLPVALVIGLPALVAAHALLERRRVREIRRWPTTAAEFNEEAACHQYFVRGQAHGIRIPVEAEAEGATVPGEVRVHYDPEHPEQAFLTDAPLPSLLQPVASSILLALALAALIFWLV